MNKNEGKFDSKNNFIVDGEKPEVYKKYFEIKNQTLKGRMQMAQKGDEVLAKLYHLTEFVISIVEELDYETLSEFNNLHKSFELLRIVEKEEDKESLLITLKNALDDKIDFYRKLYGYVSEKNTVEEQFNVEKIRTRNLLARIDYVVENIVNRRNNVANYFEMMCSQVQMLQEYETQLNNANMLEEIYRFIINKSILILNPTQEDLDELKEANDFVNSEQLEMEYLTECLTVHEVMAKVFLQRIRLEECIKEIRKNEPTR